MLNKFKKVPAIPKKTEMEVFAETFAKKVLKTFNIHK